MTYQKAFKIAKEKAAKMVNEGFTPFYVGCEINANPTGFFPIEWYIKTDSGTCLQAQRDLINHVGK